MPDNLSLKQRPTPQARRQQILDAACGCVRQTGFHGAAMAEIAKASGLSVGQIYRYFDNKEAIVAAIVAQDQDALRETLAEIERRPGPFLEVLIERIDDAIDKCYDPGRAALVLEVLAEASRNPKVATIVRDANLRERALVSSLMSRSRRPSWSDTEFAARTEVIGAVFDGLVMRAVNHPLPDRSAVSKVVRDLLAHLLS